MYGVATQNGVGVSLGNIPTLTSLAYPQGNGFILLESGIQQYILQESGAPPIRIQLE